MSGKWLHLTQGGLISGAHTVVTTNNEKSADVIVGKMYRRTEQYSYKVKNGGYRFTSCRKQRTSWQLMER
ncbi:hypothetical protein C7P71_05840 [Staphylococcus aureus]|nr:hypothetical protein NV77_13635 [Staphylococcus aureus]OHV99213.1 hypothetical protein BKL70_13610 [Staphylococcus aureus]PZH01145.1 hypothetical protein C7R08_01870 [Staphylococcus aureus]PZJ79390.1 hypothetical protein C7P71_05840 [Staphylococcus aureus]